MNARLIHITLSTLVLLLYQLPADSFGLPLAALANVLVLALIVTSVIYGRSSLLSNPVAASLVAGMGLVGVLCIISKYTSFGEVPLALRLLVLTPMAMMLSGIAIAQNRLEDLPTIITPPSIVGPFLMSWALTKPFVGEFRPDLYLWEGGRVFVNPVSNQPMWPVTLSETCASAFVLFFFFFGSLPKWSTVLRIPLAVGACAVAIISATRTYIFVTIAVYVVIVLRRLIIDRRYKDLLLVSSLFGFVLFCVLVYEPVRNDVIHRIDRFVTEDGVFGSSDRVEIWITRLDLAKGLPWLGGLGVIDYFDRFELSSHDLWLDYWIMGGVVFLLAVLVVVIYALVRAALILMTPQANPIVVATVSGFLLLAGVSLISSPVVSSPFAHSLFWLMVGCVIGCRRRQGSGRRSAQSAIRPTLTTSVGQAAVAR